MNCLLMKILPSKLAKHFPQIGNAFDNYDHGDGSKRTAGYEQTDRPEQLPNFHR